MTHRLIGFFKRDNAGGVTVDWVVLTASVIGMGIAAFAMYSRGTQNLTGNISGTLSSQTIATAF